MCLIDLSSGRSPAARIALEATADPSLGGATVRWLVFHRWTRRHIPAAAGLVHGENGILDVGVAAGHDRDRLQGAIRFVRTAVVDPDSAELSGLRPAQVAWLRGCDQDLRRLAAVNRAGRPAVLGSVPLDPVLHWREQLLSDNDVTARDIANRKPWKRSTSWHAGSPPTTTGPAHDRPRRVPLLTARAGGSYDFGSRTSTRRPG